MLRQSDLKAARACALKENLRPLWRYKRLSAANSHWKSLYFWATHCRLNPVVKAAKMLKSCLTQVFKYFVHRVTDALSEGINSKVEAIKNAARGYRNAEHFKIMIWFRLGACHPRETLKSPNLDAAKSLKQCWTRLASGLSLSLMRMWIGDRPEPFSLCPLSGQIFGNNGQRGGVYSFPP
uniref:transposase n=1 Tax=Geomesophilobacter sediminis TaxID=2798584 RepID=UPI0022A7AD0F|nr:transposase [Geomesophilobacter sediminis]